MNADTFWSWATYAILAACLSLIVAAAVGLALALLGFVDEEDDDVLEMEEAAWRKAQLDLIARAGKSTCCHPGDLTTPSGKRRG